MINSPNHGEEEWTVAKGADKHLQQAKGAAHNSIKEVSAQYGFKVHMDNQVAKSGRASDALLNQLAPMRVARLTNSPKKMKRNSARKAAVALIIISIALIVLALAVLASTPQP